LETKHELREEDHPCASDVAGNLLRRRGAGCACKITLPHDAALGKTILPAGQYSISLELGGISKMFVTSENGTTMTFVAIPGTVEVTPSCDKTSVTLQRKGSGAWSVTSVCFGELQMALYFPPQSSETALAALSPHAESVTGAR
jgi:hypothetical protein